MYAGQNFGAPPQPPYAGPPPTYAGPPPTHPAAHRPTPPGQAYGAPLQYGGPPPQASSMGQGHVGGHDPLLIATNPDAFARMFREHLAALTWNSKPIINNLTIIAHEHIHRMASVVAKSLDDHIMQSHPSIRLPSLYLLDSICKNIGQPYTSLWAERIVTIFLESYRLVDQPTKMRMEELLATWKDAAPGGRPLFGENTQWSIERPLFGSAGMPLPGHRPTPPPPQAQHHPHAHHAPPDHGKARAIESIDRLLAMGAQELRVDPNNSAIRERHESLTQLKLVLQTAALSPEEMAQVHAQLDSLTASGSKPPPAPVNATPPPAPAPAPAPIPANLATAPAASGQPDAASALIASLMQAGLLPGSGAAAAAAAPAPVELDQDDEYVRSIMSLDIKVSGPEFSREPPALELLLHKHLPLQCRQCANRYPSGGKGQKGMDEHLDWHFTQNRRAKDSQARGQSRSWFDKLDSFIRGGFDDAAPSSKAGDEAGAKDGSLNAAQDKALKEKFAKSFVAAPTDAELSAKPCPICKESFKSQWSEDEEEWIWLNAIEVDGVYYHASCHYSAKMLTESVARRMSSPPGGGRQSTGLLTAKRGTSRSATPSNGAQRSASVGNPIARLKGEEGIASSTDGGPNGADAFGGTRKRKASVGEGDGQAQGAATEPPSKKVA
ncbi:related to PCF11 component of pre-mRNA 3`-end processing factor CF I [Pseudozyma flocculosa]|uniref:Related to PCF11 component of pre-mRNA 3`-end processing factor CF I n=1 Tax=Pseudozyma flocculosa TaxID=84751 RepID=A0A5C3F3H3_9BASI|nr:related to PCF11 component of pre-mRNA 3`-end processing factor CF I [Pseudozyma flocculosa]